MTPDSAPITFPLRTTTSNGPLEYPYSTCLLRRCEPCESCGQPGAVWPSGPPEPDDPPPEWCEVAAHDHPEPWQCTVRWETHTPDRCRAYRAAAGQTTRN